MLPRFLTSWKRPFENYGYLNASLRARKSSFLEWGDFCRIARGTRDDLEKVLLQPPYAESYRASLVLAGRSVGVLGRIEAALSEGAGRQLLWVKNTAQGEAHKLVEVALSRADLHNARILLRAFSVGGQRGKEPLWHLYGVLPASFFSTLWRTQGILEATERALSYGHPLSGILGASLAEMGKGSGQVLAEKVLLRRMVAFMRSDLKGIGGANGRILREYLGLLIDLWNLGVWLRRRSGSHHGGVPGGHFIEGGSALTVDRLEKVLVLRELVHGTFWGRVVRNIESVSPQDFQRELQVHFWKWQLGLFRRDPLSIGVALGFIAMQIIEWNNLNTISVGQTLGLSGAALIQRLIPLGDLPEVKS